MSRARPSSSPLLKVCARCGQERAHKPRSSNPSKPQPYCPPCTSDYLRDYREKRWQREKARNTWRGMIRRCHDPERKRWANCPSVPRWADYGGRGITVCKRWRDPEKGFANFVADLGLPPTKDSTLDRKNFRRNYTPSNTRWTDPQTQQENKRTTHWVEAEDPNTYEVLRLSITGWSRRMGINRTTIHSRIRRGWKEEHACTVPVGKPEDGVDADVPF